MKKYLVASSGDTLDSKVSRRFGHSPYFLVINPQTMEFKVFQGIGKDEYMQGIGKYVNPGIKKVIVGNIGPSAYNEVTASGCSVYICRNMPVREAISMIQSLDTAVDRLYRFCLSGCMKKKALNHDKNGKTGCTCASQSTNQKLRKMQAISYPKARTGG